MNYMPRQMEANTNVSYQYIAPKSTASCAEYKATTRDYVDDFYAHLQKWRSETYYLSSATELQKHPSFQAIVRMGENVISLILDDLKKTPSLLLFALAKITDETVVAPVDRGNVRAMANAWISWGERNGY